MRVTQGMLTQQFLYNLSNINQQLAKDQEEMSTGKSLNKPSDNPLALSQDMSIQETLTQSNAFSSTISAGLSWTKNTSSVVQDMINSLQSIQTNVNNGINASSENPSQLQGLYDTTKQLVDQIMTDVNTKQNNNYVFSGSQVNVPASVVASGTLVSGAFYESPQSSGGQGTTQTSPPATIAQTISDPSHLLQPGDAYKLVFQATPSGNSSTIQSGSLTLETASGSTVASLSSIPSGTTSGSTLTLASPSGTLSVTLGGMFQPASGATGTLSYSQTDLLTPSAGVTGTLNYEVAPNVSIPVNLTAEGMFHTIASGASQDLQSTLNSILSDFSSMSQAAQNHDQTTYNSKVQDLQNQLTNLTANTNQVTNMNSELGSRVQRLNALQTQMTQYTTILTNQQSNLVDANMPNVITKYTTDQTVYQAALKMGANVLLPSLVSYLPNG